MDFIFAGDITDKKEILLATRSLVPHYFEVNCNELKFTNTCFKWRTSVT